MRRGICLLALVCALGLATPVTAETLPDALTEALRNNPTLEDARLAVAAAREDRAQARAAYLPSVDASARYGSRELERKSASIFGPSTTNTGLEPYSSQIQATQSLYSGGRRAAQMDLANAGIDANREALRATEQDVLLATVTSYAEILRDENIVRIREQGVQNLERQLRGTQRRLDVGEVTRTDLAQAEARLAGARAALASARAALDATRGRYAETVGAPAGVLAPSAAPAATPALLEDAIARALTNHPDIRRAQQNEEGARARREIERAAMRPQLSVVGRYDQNEQAQQLGEIERSSNLYAQITVPLFEGGYRASRLRQSHINIQRAEQQTEAQRRFIERSVISAWSDLSAARQVVEAARQQVAANEAALAGAEREQGLGLRSTIDVLNAQQELQDSQVTLARAEASALISSYGLLAAVGDLNAETLGLVRPS